MAVRDPRDVAEASDYVGAGVLLQGVDPAAGGWLLPHVLLPGADDADAAVRRRASREDADLGAAGTLHHALLRSYPQRRPVGCRGQREHPPADSTGHGRLLDHSSLPDVGALPPLRDHRRRVALQPLQHLVQLPRASHGGHRSRQGGGAGGGGADEKWRQPRRGRAAAGAGRLRLHGRPEGAEPGLFEEQPRCRLWVQEEPRCPHQDPPPGGQYGWQWSGRGRLSQWSKERRQDGNAASGGD
mmetsp:Transcript_70151/g.160855  ORF Transcript_70151/g.160855 Transcript_70151/m.160855 type:complete len:242 (-) Transcript_70151:115-840(-)